MKTTLPPGPRGHFLLGSLPELRRNPLEFISTVAATYGDIVYAHAVNIPVYLFNHPDQVEQILVTDNRHFIKPKLLRDAGEVLGRGLLTSDGDFWLRQRRLMQPAFHRDRIASYGESMVKLTEAGISNWRDGEIRNIHEEMMHITLSIVAHTLFGADVADHAEEVGYALELALQRFVERMSLMRLFDALPLPRNIRFKRALSRLDGIIYGMIDERRRSGEQREDLLSLLLHAHDEDGSQMTDRQLRDESITLFLAGHETTAIALSWTWYLLSEHPAVAEKLVAEIEEVLGERSPGLDDLPRLRYTEMIVRESMRLYPPAWRVGREVIEECEVGGYLLPVGAQVVMSQWVIHRDPRFFDDPLSFRPERWENDLAKQLPKFAYFPFGGGARRCIGDTFAMMEATLMLVTIARRLRLTLVPGHPVATFPSITLRPRHGLKMKVERR